jgi:hypothetical protein
VKSYRDSDIDCTRLTIISPALENLSIETANGRSFNDMVCLLQYTPYLRTLSRSIRCENDNEIFSTTLTSIATLKLVFSGAPHVLNKLFQNMPNLYNLTIVMRNCYLTGHEWKQILINNLPKIKIFRFKMHIPFVRVDDSEERIDEALNTFQNSFWLDKHQWFVQCDWNPKDGPISNTLYSLPYAFDTFIDIKNGRSKWTNSDDRRECWSLNRV